MNLWQRIKKAFENYLYEMEKANKQMFGSGTPNCCNLNNQQKNRKN